MKIKRNLFSAIVCAVAACTVFGSFSASAEGIDEAMTPIDVIMETDNKMADNPITRGWKIPNDLWDWNNGDYGINHNETEGGMFYPMYGGHGTNTSYKFQTGTGKLKVDFSLIANYNYTNPRTLVLKLYRTAKNKSSWSFVESDSYDFTPDPHDMDKSFDGTCTFSNLSNDYYYYIRFYNDSDGWESTSDVEYYSFSGDFSISN